MKKNNSKNESILESFSQENILNQNDIFNLYNEEYEDSFFNILLKSKTSFLNTINSSMKEIFSSLSEEIINKIKTDINNRYNKDYELISKAYNNIKEGKDEYNYLSNFIKHCPSTDNNAYHVCIDNKINKYYEIKENNEIKYIFCPFCKFCFLPKCIKMVCVFCNKEYFSRVLNNNEEKNIFLANWNKYHCGSMKNHIMKCINCKNNLYINLSTNNLICKNKDCNFSSNPLSILWKCIKCGKDFRSNAKVYNFVEIEIIKKAIKKTLIKKQKAFPKELPCCKKNPENFEFSHNDKCKGILYDGFLFNRKILVCNICHALNFEEKFTWTCPLCEIKFHLKQFNNFIKPFKSGKYIINKEQNLTEKNRNKIDINNIKTIVETNDSVSNNISINNYFEKINYFYNNTTDVHSYSRDKRKKKHRRIESISIDNSSSKNKSNIKEKSFEKKEKKYKTMIDILEKRKSDSEKNKTSKDINFLNDFSFKFNNSFNYYDKLNFGKINKEKKQNRHNSLVYQHKKVSDYKHSRQNKIDKISKINNCISQIILDKNNPLQEKETIKLNSIYNTNIGNKNKSCLDINSKTIYKNKKINQKKYMINRTNSNIDINNKEKINYIYTKNTIKKDNNIFENDIIPTLEIRKKKNINKNTNTQIYRNKIIPKTLYLNIDNNNEEPKKHNRRKSLNIDNENKTKIYNKTLNNLVSNETISKIARSCIIPDFINEYKYKRIIGEGTKSSIYLVENTKNKKEYALKKILCKNLSEILEYKSQFELLYSINHPNIMKIYKIHFKYLDFSTYSINALLEKAKSDLSLDIKKHISINKYFFESEIINIMKQIIDALIYMKKRGIAHRDIKPQNILIFPGNIYKLGDFSEAKSIQNLNNKITLRGSELYMSPILFRNYKIKYPKLIHDVYKSDVFSLGFSMLFAICLNIRVLEDIRELNNMGKIAKVIDIYFNRKIYSNKLYNLILGMIELDEKKRYNFEKIHNILQSW